MNSYLTNFFRAIPEGIWAGSFTPNLNGEGRFLRGGQDNNVLTLEEDTFQGKYLHTEKKSNLFVFEILIFNRTWAC